MAAVTIASGPNHMVVGNRRQVRARLTAPADGDTWATGLQSVEDVKITPIGTTLAAADAFGVNSISGGTITFEVVGTARDLLVTALGI
jgi:hypothetical protein